MKDPLIVIDRKVERTKLISKFTNSLTICFNRRHSRVEDDIANSIVADNDSDGRLEQRENMSDLMRQKSADEDVDESCIADPGVGSSLDEDSHSHPEIIRWTDRGELEATQLVPIEEEVNSSTETSGYRTLPCYENFTRDALKRMLAGG